MSDWSADVCSSDLTSYVTAMPFLSVAAGQIHTIGASLLATLPFLVTFCTLWPMYAVIPNTRVSRRDPAKIGRASGREQRCPSVYITVLAASLKKNKTNDTHIHMQHTII